MASSKELGQLRSNALYNNSLVGKWEKRLDFVG